MAMITRHAQKAVSGAPATPVAHIMPQLRPSARCITRKAAAHPQRRPAVHVQVAAALDGTSPSSQGLLAQEIRTMPPPEVADTLWAYVLTHGYDAGICATVASVVLEDLNKFSPATLTAVLSAFAQVNHVDRDFVVVVCSWMAQPYKLAELDTGTLAQAGWVLAMLSGQGVVRVEEEEEVQNLITALARQAQRKVADFAPDDLARLLAAFGELRVPPPQLFMQAACDRLVQFAIPLSQLEPAALAQVTWAYARLGTYNRELFDAAQRDMQRKANELSWQAVAQAAWAFAQVREEDAKHRAAYDVNFFATLAAQATRLLNAALNPNVNPSPSPSPNGSGASSQSNGSHASGKSTNGHGNGSSVGSGGSGENGAVAAMEAALKESRANGAEAKDSAPSEPPPVHGASLLTLLLAHANVSHGDDALFRQAGRWFARHVAAGECSAQDLVVLSFVYSRMKQPAPELMLAAAQFLPQVAGELDGDDLVYLASWGPATSLYNETLFRRVVDEALSRAADSPLALSADQLLDLARCTAAVIGRDEAHYSQIQQQLLKAVNAAHLHSEMEMMSTHCGATAPDTGLQK